MFLKHKICFKSADFWTCAARYYRVEDGRVSTCDLLITLRERGILFWRSTGQNRSVEFQKTDDGRTIFFFCRDEACNKRNCNFSLITAPQDNIFEI
jgi:hypothetical protein